MFRLNVLYKICLNALNQISPSRGLPLETVINSVMICLSSTILDEVARAQWGWSWRTLLHVKKPSHRLEKGSRDAKRCQETQFDLTLVRDCWLSIAIFELHSPASEALAETGAPLLTVKIACNFKWIFILPKYNMVFQVLNGLDPYPFSSICIPDPPNVLETVQIVYPRLRS